VTLTEVPNVGAADRLPVALDIVAAFAIVTLFELLFKAPLVRVRVLLTVTIALRETPEPLLMVRLFTVAGRPLPVTWAAVPS